MPPPPMVTSKPKVLLIDEDPADRSLAVVVLSAACAGPVCEVGDSANLIAALRDGAYDAIVTEIGIDDASSTFQIEAMRAIQVAAPVIVFTHQNDPLVRRQALAAGATAFVGKSTRGFVELADTVREVLGKASADLPPPSTETKAVAGEEPPAFALDPLPPREPTAAGLRATLDRATPFFARVRSSLDHGIGRGLAIFFGVVAISALLSALFGTFGQEDVVAQGGKEPSGMVLSATATADEGLPPDPEEQPELPAEPGEVAEPDNGAPSVQPAAAPPRPTAPIAAPLEGPVTLQLRATDDVWVNARVDGVETFDVIMTAGQARNLTAQRHVELRIGNADGLQVVWNGKDIGRLGRPDQVRRLHFTPTIVGPGPPPDD